MSCAISGEEMNERHVNDALTFLNLEGEQGVRDALHEGHGEEPHQR